MAWFARPSLPFTIEVEGKPPWLTLCIQGELDFSCAGELVCATSGHTRGVTQVRLDLAHLDFCDVAGLRALDALCSTHRAAGREVEVVGARAVLRKIAALTRLFPDCLEQPQRQDR